MAGWREEATAVLKAALVKETDPKEIREIASAMSGLQPYDSSPPTAEPMPVRIVGKGKPKKKKWVPPKKKGS